MSVRLVKTPKGFKYDIRFQWPDGDRLREKGTCPLTARDACRRWAEQREHAIWSAGKDAYKAARTPKPSTSAVPAAPKGMTLAQLWPRVVSDHYRANRKKASTIDAAESIYRNHLAPTLSNKSIALITTADVAALKGALASKGAKTVNNVLSVLSRALRCAVEWDLLPAIPCRFGLLKVPTAERDWYEVHEYRRLVEAAEKVGPEEHLLVLLAGSAGLRRGEIQELKWTDLDLARAQLRVDRNVWRGVVDMPKGGRGRIVPLTHELVAALKAHRLRTGLSEQVLLHKGRKMSNRQVRDAMSRAQRRAGLEANGGIHLLRHTFCSHLAIAGVPAKAIQELAGHSDLKTTLRYMHLAPNNRSEAIGALSRYYKEERADVEVARVG